MLRGRDRLLGIFAAAVVLAAFPAASRASGSEGASTPPARGKVTVYLPDAFFVHGQAVTVPKRVVHVVGIVRPYVADQRVTVRAFLGRRLIESKRLRLIPSRNGTYGHFRLGVSSPGAGTLGVSVTHKATPQQSAFSGRRGLAS